MSHDAMAGYVYTLNPDLIVQHAKPELDALMEAVDAADFTLTFEVAKWWDTQDWDCVSADDTTDEQLDAIETAFKAVQAKMLEATGLEIGMTYIDEDSGSVYNEVSGGVWFVVNATEFTAPAKKYEEYITHNFFCIFG